MWAQAESQDVSNNLQSVNDGQILYNSIRMKGLSVIIPSYNTKDMTVKCVTSLEHILHESKIPSEIIVVDNGSTDGTQDALKDLSLPSLYLIHNKENKGFGKANNQGLNIAKGDYILFLNSDVLVDKLLDISSLLEYFHHYKNVGAVTVRVNLPNSSIDPASHRGFPTLWRSFCYFSGLEKLFSHAPYLNHIFGGYHLVYLNKNIVHEIESPTGAFYLAPRNVLDMVKGFDEDFFMYGEDLDLSYRIKQKGYKILYIPQYSVLHYKGQSGIQHREDIEVRKKVKKYFYSAMATFYKKHYAKSYPSFVNTFVYFLIDIKMKII